MIRPLDCLEDEDGAMISAAQPLPSPITRDETFGADGNAIFSAEASTGGDVSRLGAVLD